MARASLPVCQSFQGSGRGAFFRPRADTYLKALIVGVAYLASSQTNPLSTQGCALCERNYVFSMRLMTCLVCMSGMLMHGNVRSNGRNPHTFVAFSKNHFSRPMPSHWECLHLFLLNKLSDTVAPHLPPPVHAARRQLEAPSRPKPLLSSVSLPALDNKVWMMLCLTVTSAQS